MGFMTEDTPPTDAPASRRQRFRSWAGSLALTLGLVIAALLIAETGAVQDLSAGVDAALQMYPWLIAIPIGLIVAGGALMLGAQFLPAPSRQNPRSDEALDAAAVPIEYGEARGHWSRSMQMEATTGQVREAWRRRSWRYSRKWRVLFAMMLGALLLAVGFGVLFIMIGPPFIKVLATGLAAYVAVRILWEFTVS
jgi:hypothetical protein